MTIDLRSNLCKILLHTTRIGYAKTYDMRGKQVAKKMQDLGIITATPEEIHGLGVSLACKCMDIEKIITSAQNLQECLEEAIRATMGVTLLSEYGQLPEEYNKKTELLAASTSTDIQSIVQLRVVTSVMRTIARKGILTTTNTNELAKQVYSAFCNADIGTFVFECTVYDDFVCLQNILDFLADQIMDFKNSATFTMLWIGMHEFVFRHYQHWGVCPPRDDRATHWLNMLETYIGMGKTDVCGIRARHGHCFVLSSAFGIALSRKTNLTPLS